MVIIRVISPLSGVLPTIAYFFPYVRKGFLKGVYKGSIVGFYNLGALIVLIGFWGPLYYKHNKEHPKIV